jgi:hypothetical protein
MPAQTDANESAVKNLPLLATRKLSGILANQTGKK